MAKNGNYFTHGINGKQIYDHRTIAEQILGRPLTEQETVHHVNGNGFDNNQDNLWIFQTKADHSRFHRTGVAIKQENGTYIAGKRQPENPCLHCGKMCFAKFCSLKCASIEHRKVERPPVEDILKLLETMSFCAVGRRFGVTDNAVRKWIGLKK